MFGRNDRRVRAEPQRLEHRHGGSDAEGAREIAGGGDHAAVAAADDHRLVGERRVVALLDRGIERVAIDMGDRKGVELADGERGAASRNPRNAAGRPAASARQSRQKPGVTARRAPIGVRSSALCARDDVEADRSRLSAAKASSSASSPAMWSSTPARNSGSRAAARIRRGRCRLQPGNGPTVPGPRR